VCCKKFMYVCEVFICDIYSKGVYVCVCVCDFVEICECLLKKSKTIHVCVCK
jgi:hypothetical protein